MIVFMTLIFTENPGSTTVHQNVPCRIYRGDISKLFHVYFPFSGITLLRVPTQLLDREVRQQCTATQSERNPATRPCQVTITTDSSLKLHLCIQDTARLKTNRKSQQKHTFFVQKIKEKKIRVKSF